MDFLQAINIVKNALNETGTEINLEDYDGLIVKKLAASNTLDTGRRTNQTHIAITGEQMDIFPYLCADGYFYDDNRIVNEDLKKYFVIRIHISLFRSNCLYLGASDNDLHFSGEVKETGACVVRSKRAAQTDQLQLSMLNSDGPDFVTFRKLLHEGSILIMLKCKNSMKYNVFGIKPDDCNSEVESLNNKFFRLTETTVVDTDVFSQDASEMFNIEVGHASNELYYGVPGSGKSHTIDRIVKDSEYERVVFHPDYTYSDFVGQIMPRLKRNADGTEKLTYEFVPGPFTKALKAAVDNEDSMHYLVIEEINRGNAPAIFGDVFQLLDRNEDGSGKYHITNFDIGREVYDGDENAPISIPSNLSILATMNTSDQNVFTLDTAFQRRWNMKYIENNVTEAEHADEKIEYSNVTWGGFASAVNEEILEYNAELSSSEDKQLGAYFVTKAELTSDKFPEKALKYLWDDAFKLEREKIFRPEIKSVGDLVHSYDVEIQNDRDPIKGVMRAEVYRKMMDMSASGPEEAIDESEIFEAEINDGE